MDIVLSIRDAAFDENHKIVLTADQCADLRELFSLIADQDKVIDFIAPFYGATEEQKQIAIDLAKAEADAAIEGNDTPPTETPPE